MKRTLRGLGIGIFLAGVFLYLNNIYTIPYIHTDIDEKKYKDQITELQATIEQQQKQIEKLSSTQGAKQPATETKTQTKNISVENKQPEPSTSNDVITETLYVYEGMSLYNIGQQAQDLGLVKVGRELELYLSNPTYAKLIQKGAFELRSDMTYEEMAKILTGKNKGNE